MLYWRNQIQPWEYWEQVYSTKTDLQSIKEENEILKSEMKKRETEGSKANYSALALVEAARTAEKEALVKLVHLTEEADNSIRKATCVTEQLDAS